MYTLILLASMGFIFLVGGQIIYNRRYKSSNYPISEGIGIGGKVLGVFLLLMFISFSLSLINIDKRIQETIYKYENIVQMVDSYNGQDYGNMGSLVEAVVEMNNCIATNKAQYDSKWTGLWHSERIARLVPITFNKKVQDTPSLE